LMAADRVSERIANALAGNIEGEVTPFFPMAIPQGAPI
jgi:hypothetical protein